MGAACKYGLRQWPVRQRMLLRHFSSLICFPCMTSTAGRCDSGLLWALLAGVGKNALHLHLAGRQYACACAKCGC